MLTLEDEELAQLYEGEPAEQTQKADTRQAEIAGVKVKVDEDYKAEAVVLTIGDRSLYMTLHQARELALEIRKSSNLLERSMLDRGVKPGKKKGHHRR